MNWFEWVDSLFSFHAPIAIIVGTLFLVPIIRLITAPFAFASMPVIKASGMLGRWEHAIGWMRNWLCTPYLVGVSGWNAYRWIENAPAYPWSHFAALAGTALLLVVINELYRAWKRNGLLDLMDFAIRFPTTHPQEFFDYYYATLGCFHVQLPQKPRRQIDPSNIDMRKRNGGRARYAFWPVVVGARNIMSITRLILNADRWRGPSYARKVGASLAPIGSTRAIQLAQASVNVENIEVMRGLRMPIIYCCNHTSALDFLIISLLLLAHRRIAGIDMMTAPCFLMARDHFLENPFLYRVLGLGRAAEILGMIFVERKHSSKSKAQGVVHQAVEKVLEAKMPLIIYPQGTRARSRIAADGSRLDAGYYAVGSVNRLKREGAHIKKGVSFIAVDAARTLASHNMQGRINLVPVAFMGAANTLPRKSIRAQLGASIVMRTGDPLAVTADMAADMDEGERSDAYHTLVDSLHRRIDDALKATCRVHAELECRFFEDVRNVIDPLKIDELSIAMKPWRHEDYLIYTVLDYIYACKPREWHSLLGQLVHLILTDAPREDIVAFRDRVADIMPK